MNGTGRHTSRRIAAALTVLFAIVAAATLTGSATALTNGYSSTPSILSDKADYSPGETVTLNGYNWAAAEVVHVNVNDDDGQTWTRDVDVVASATGEITDQFQLPAFFVANYKVTATGAVSGTATTTFTDGNVTLHLPATEGVADMTVTFDRWNGNMTCGGTATLTNQTVTTTSGGTVNIPGFGGNGDSVRLKSVSTTTPGKIFSRWTSGDKNTDSGVDVPGTPTPCISNSAGGANGNLGDAYAHFVNTPNSPPAIASNNAGVNANEGATATNTGTWSDANSGDTVTLSASVGTVTKAGTNASGTWSWSFATTDGPAQSGTVTITADDGHGGVTSTSFALGVSNVAPSVTGPANQTATEDVSKSFNLGSFTDPGADSPWTASLDWGDTSSNTVFNQTSTGTITAQSHTYADPGTFTVSLKIKDKDNATSNTVTFTVTVAANNHAPTANAGGPYSGNEGSAIQLDGSGSSDPDAGDTLTYAWSVNGGAPCSFSSATAQKPTITCTDNGSYTVSLTVTDNHGASSGASTAALNVANVAPSATFTNTGPVNETQSFQLSLSGATDPSSADTTAGFQYAFDCGDGSGYGVFGASNSRTCSTSDDGVRSVKGKVKDKDGGVNEYTGSVTVNNVAPTISSVTNNGPIDEGGSATITVTASDVAGAADPLSYEFDCNNDGTYEVGPQAGNSHTCSFPQSGSRQVNVRVSDGDGGSATGSTTVTVRNVAPTISSVTNNGPIDEGGSATITVAASDPADTLSYEFDCNNDSAYEVGPQAGNSHACSFDDNGARQVNVRVSDGDGGTATGSTTVTVNNVAPTATFSNDGPVDEGTSFHLSLTDPSDVSGADTAAGFQYAFDCGSGSGYGAFGSSNTASCPTTDSGTRSVKGKIKDKDGGVSEYTASVTVKNVAPSLSGQTDQSSDEGSSKSFDLGSFSDASGDSPWKVHVDWGDGSSSDPADKAATGSLGNASHTYDDDGIYTVTVKVTDKDGASGQATFKATVGNVAPTATLGNDGPVDEGSPATVSFSAQHDPSNADTAAGFHYAFDCANGSLAGATYANSGTGASKQCTFADNGTYTVRARIIDKDGGSNEYTTAVVVKNVPPKLTPPSDDTGLEGSAKSFGLGSFSDAGVNDNPWKLHITWGDGSAATDLTYNSAGALGMAPHAYADNGVYTVTETLTDKDGGSDTQTFKVTIANVDPTADLGNNGPVDEGSAATVSFSNQQDASSADTAAGFHYAYACDNGSLAGATYASSGTAATKSCTFADDGTYPVRARIIDKDNGFTEYTTNVAVENVPPKLSGQADQSSDEGSSKSFDLGSFSDPGADSPWKVHVDWGDGSSSDPADKTATGSLGNASHTYDDNGTYTVTVKVTDKDGSSDSATFKVAVANVAPTATLGNDGPVDEGSPATASFSAQHDPSNADTTAGFHYAYACDNGSLAGATYAGSGTAASKQCTYADNGTYTVRARIIDKDGGFNEYTTAVVVKNVAPTLTPPADDTGDEGSSKSFGLGSFSDPGANDDPWKLHVTWGDGSAATDLTYNSRGALGLAPHAYADNGTYTVTETITDKDGGSDTQTFKVVIKNVDPTVTAAADQASNEGSSKSFDLGSFSDPGANDNPWKVHVDWGDGSSSDPADKTATGSLGNASHTYDDNGNYTVKVTVTDKDGGSGSATYKVDVANVAPTGTLGNNGPVNEATPATVSFSGQHDASNADTAAGFHYSYACDGTEAALASNYAGATDGASKQCTFADNGTYTVRARIFDKDNGYTQYSTDVVVKNVPPTVTAAADQSSNEGSSKSFDLGSFSDPGANDNPWKVHVDWGDGSSSDPADKTATGSLGNASHTYDDNGNYTVKVTVTDKDGGSGSATFKVAVANVAPTADLGNNGPVNEGSPATISFSNQQDPSSKDTTTGFHYSYACNGDASALATTYAGATDGASKQCTFADNGSYLVKGRIFDKDGGSSTYDTTVKVDNVKPSLTPPTDDNGVEGASKSFGLGSFSDPGANDNPWSLHITWGDGSAATDLTYNARGALGMAPHAYDDNGVYTVTETITDKDGASDTQTFKVTVSNANPTATLSNNGPVDEASPVTVSFSAQKDPSSADTSAGFHYAYACDNGSLGGATYANSGTAASKQCTFADNGTYTVRARIIDKDDGSSEYTTSVTVNNVKPTVTAPSDQSSDEGASKSFDLGSFSDPGVNDNPWAVDVNWGDSSAHYTASKSATGSLGSASHTYADNGVYTVTVKVTDKDGGSSSATFKVTVSNIAPTITSFSGTNSLSGVLVFAPTTFSGTFTDPGLVDNPWAAAWSWDGTLDPTAAQTYPANGTNTHNFSQTHQYTSASCSHTATVKITDKDGGFDTKTATVQVGAGAFLPPMTNQPVTNKLKNGQVLPVKVQLTDCSGAPLNGLSPAIRLVAGDQTATSDDGSVTITPTSASNADTTGVMRSSGSDGSYIYNMNVNIPLNQDYTVVVYPYGTTPPSNTQTLKHVIQATK